MNSKAKPSINTDEFRALLMAVCEAEARFNATAGTRNQYLVFEEASVARNALLDYIHGAMTTYAKETQ